MKRKSRFIGEPNDKKKKSLHLSDFFLSFTEVWFLAAAMAIGYLVGSLSVTLGGIPFSLGTSAGCIMAGVFVSYLRGRNPEIGGPVSEGADGIYHVQYVRRGGRRQPLVAGDLLMYLALAHTVAGFFGPLAMSIEIVAGKLPDRASEFNILKSASIGAGGVAWFLAVYGGPLVSLVRSPFHRRTNIALGIAYRKLKIDIGRKKAQKTQKGLIEITG